MLDAGFWILVFKGNYLYFIQYPVSDHCDINVRFQNFVIFVSGLSELGVKYHSISRTRVGAVAVLLHLSHFRFCIQSTYRAHPG